LLSFYNDQTIGIFAESLERVQFTFHSFLPLVLDELRQQFLLEFGDDHLDSLLLWVRAPMLAISDNIGIGLVLVEQLHHHFFLSFAEFPHV
jgi:hypothetical protein